jgi:hypothetical protein
MISITISITFSGGSIRISTLTIATIGIGIKATALGFALEIFIRATEHVLLQLLYVVEKRLRLKDVPKVEGIMLTVEMVGQSWAAKASREVGGTRGRSRGFVERR